MKYKQNVKREEVKDENVEEYKNEKKGERNKKEQF